MDGNWRLTSKASYRGFTRINADQNKNLCPCRHGVSQRPHSLFKHWSPNLLVINRFCFGHIAAISMGAARAAEVINMTQMNLEGSKKQRSAARAMARIFGLGIPATAVMTAALAVIFAVALDGCSSKSKQTNQNPTPNTNVATLPAPSPTPTATPAVAQKKVVKHRRPTVTYADKT